MATIYDFTLTDGKGNQVPLANFKGKVMLIVNTATGCGFTPHYKPIEQMYSDFHDKGFEVIDIPCNNRSVCIKHTCNRFFKRLFAFGYLSTFCALNSFGTTVVVT